MRQSRKRYLQYINPLEILKTKKVLQHNPTQAPSIETEKDSILSMFEYNDESCVELKNILPAETDKLGADSSKNYWLNVDILHTSTIEKIAQQINLHPLLVEDILSKSQRPKVDEIDQLFTCVLQMLYFDNEKKAVESEQISVVLGKNYIITFQDEENKDLFNPIRDKLIINGTKLRSKGVDYLFYSILDAIVDHYFVILEKLAEQIEELEENITQNKTDSYTMNQINDVRKELIFFKRNVIPVREIISNIIRSESKMIDEENNKYFKDVYDHIIQANDLFENYRDVLNNIRDQYFSQINLKANEVMKFLAIVTTLLAPATVIGGVFGMNFDKIPYLHHQNGFWIATFLMLVGPLLLLIYFKKKGWF